MLAVLAVAVGLAVAGYGGGAAIFGPLCDKVLIPRAGLPTTFRILAGVFLVLAFLLLRGPQL